MKSKNTPRINSAKSYEDIMLSLFPHTWKPPVKRMNTMGEVADSLFKPR
jgi:hypothetical protein